MLHSAVVAFFPFVIPRMKLARHLLAAICRFVSVVVGSFWPNAFLLIDAAAV